METDTLRNNLQLSPLNYLKIALRLLSENNLQNALQSLDAAIVFSHSCPFYIYQKIKILYDLGAYKNCSTLIVSQLEHLYKHGSLYIVCRVIDYYQLMNSIDVNELKKLLKSLRVPYSLAEDYKKLLLSRDINFLKRAKIAHVKDQHDLCISYIDIYIKNHVATPEIIHMKADSYHLLGDLNASLFYYKEYLSMQPENPNAYIYIGQVLMELNQNMESLDYFNKAVDLDPINKDCLSYLAECNVKLKKYDSALSNYQTIEKYYSSDIQNYFNILFVYKKLNKGLSIRRYSKKIRDKLKSI